MSQLDQAKKEAKRLFNLAKSQSPDENNIHLKINNLSSAREYVAIMNGSKNWHELEQNLKRKDSVFSHIDKNTENKEKRNIKYHYPYYLEEKNFTHIRNQIQEQGGQLIIQQPHQPIEIAHTRKKKLFQKEITSVIATHYPMILTGSTGAGTTKTLLSFCSQYINNHEGVIYFDAQGDNVLYNTRKPFLTCIHA